MTTTFWVRSIGVLLLTFVLFGFTTSLALAEEEIVLGLGETSNCWFEVREGNQGGYGHLTWLQMNWPAYCGAHGETHPAVGNLDGAGYEELVVGLSSGSNCYLEIRDDGLNAYNHLAWRQVNWPAYCGNNGTTWPAVGNLDADAGHEIVVGLGSGSNCYIEIRHDAAGAYAHAVWLHVNYPAYCNANGETRPAAGDLDGDGRAEIAIGFGSGSNCWLQIRDDATTGYAFLGWLQVNWPDYCAANGETRPAIGDVDNDGRAGIVVGLGHGSGGWVELRHKAAGGYAHNTWRQVQWTAYNNCTGESRPAVGDVKSGAGDKTVLGLARRICNGVGYPSGWVEVMNDASENYDHEAWLQVNWPAYNANNGETWPAVGDIHSDVALVAASATAADAEDAADAPLTVRAALDGPPVAAAGQEALTATPSSDLAVDGEAPVASVNGDPEPLATNVADQAPQGDEFYAGPEEDANGGDTATSRIFLPLITR